MSAGRVFGSGDGRIGTEVRDEVIRRDEARKDKESAVSLRKKTQFLELITLAKLIKAEMKLNTFKLISDKLRVLVTYKKIKGDAGIPLGKADLLP